MEKKELQVKMMFYIMAKTLEEIAKVDEDFKEDMEEIESAHSLLDQCLIGGKFTGNTLRFSTLLPIQFPLES